jgi:hypothetical protein
MADIGTEMNSLLSERPAPPGMSPRLVEARKFAYYGKLAFLFAALIYFIFAVLAFFSTRVVWFYGGFVSFTAAAFCYGAAMIGAVIGAFLVDKHVVATLDAGRVHEAKTNALIWAIIAFIIGFSSVVALLPALFLGISWLKMDESVAAPAPAPPPAGYPPYQPMPAPQPAYATPPPPGGGYVPPPPPEPGLPPPPPP